MPEDATKVELHKLWKSKKPELLAKLVDELKPYGLAGVEVRASNFLLMFEEEIQKAAADEHLATLG
jgi:hypothetical protein